MYQITKQLNIASNWQGDISQAKLSKTKMVNSARFARGLHLRRRLSGFGLPRNLSSRGHRRRCSLGKPQEELFQYFNPSLVQ